MEKMNNVISFVAETLLDYMSNNYDENVFIQKVSQLDVPMNCKIHIVKEVHNVIRSRKEQVELMLMEMYS